MYVCVCVCVWEREREREREKGREDEGGTVLKKIKWREGKEEIESKKERERHS